jgi:hypothetical protein
MIPRPILTTARLLNELIDELIRRFTVWARDVDERNRRGDFGKYPWQKDYGLWPWQRKRRGL